MGRRILRISSTFLVDLFGAGGNEGWEVFEDPLPRDTRLINATIAFPYHENGGDLELLIESAEWPEVGQGELIPEINPHLRRLYLPTEEVKP